MTFQDARSGAFAAPMASDGLDAIDAPGALVAAIDGAELRAPLPPSVRKLVADSLAAPTWPMLAAASRALRVIARLSREDKRPIPVSVLDALADVRACMAQLRGGS